MYELFTNTMTTIGDATFSDTTDEYVLKAKNAGFINGVGNNLFEPDREITRDEIAALFVKLYDAAGIEYSQGETSQVFDDNDQIADWAKKYVQIAKANEIVNGIGNNLFAPKQKATREMALIMFNRTIEKFDNSKIQNKRKTNEENNYWGKNYEKYRVYSLMNPYKFPEWAFALDRTSECYSYYAGPGSDFRVEPILNVFNYTDPIKKEDFPEMIKNVRILIPVLETAEEYSINKMIPKTFHKITDTDWNRAYQVITQKYAYPSLTKEKFNLMKKDLISIINSPRIEIPNAPNTWFGLIDNQYYSAYYDLGNNLAATIESHNLCVTLVIQPRNGKTVDSYGKTFSENIEEAYEYPEFIKYLDLR